MNQADDTLARELTPNEKIFTLVGAKIFVDAAKLKQLLLILSTLDQGGIMLMAKTMYTDPSNPAFGLAREMNDFLAFCGQESPSDKYN